MVAGLTAAAGAAAAGSPSASDSGEAHRIHIVSSGDTLWAIAVRVAGPNSDPRPLVDAIAERNDVDGPIFPGQALVIPAG
jgi:nucleoid-associated protein YgaU